MTLSCASKFGTISRLLKWAKWMSCWSRGWPLRQTSLVGTHRTHLLPGLGQVWLIVAPKLSNIFSKRGQLPKVKNEVDRRVYQGENSCMNSDLFHLTGHITKKIQRKENFIRHNTNKETNCYRSQTDTQVIKLSSLILNLLTLTFMQAASRLFSLLQESDE